MGSNRTGAGGLGHRTQSAGLRRGTPHVGHLRDVHSRSTDPVYERPQRHSTGVLMEWQGDRQVVQRRTSAAGCSAYRPPAVRFERVLVGTEREPYGPPKLLRPSERGRGPRLHRRARMRTAGATGKHRTPGAVIRMRIITRSRWAVIAYVDRRQGRDMRRVMERQDRRAPAGRRTPIAESVRSRFASPNPRPMAGSVTQTGQRKCQTARRERSEA
jgi:hypothetical protein